MLYRFSTSWGGVSPIVVTVDGKQSLIRRLLTRHSCFFAVTAEIILQWRFLLILEIET
jgi:hypothetical protein